MNSFSDIAGAYFIGIGGIGMSALARYFLYRGCIVAGYDRTKTSLTEELENEGCSISYYDNHDLIPALFINQTIKEKLIIVYTPAIPPENNIFRYFTSKGYRVYKRSEVLGEISRSTDTLAVAGTHGKTTVSTLLAHILKISDEGCSAFLGGISRNYNSNIILSHSRFTVMEADEYDRSFHRLSPLMAVITSADADHLDIYGDYNSMLEAYSEFCRKIRKNGKLLINESVTDKIAVPSGIETYTYGFSERAFFRICNTDRIDEFYVFDLLSKKAELKKLAFPFPGRMNCENAGAAASMAILCGVKDNIIREALRTFAGVKRRFDIIINRPGLTYIDDYAHHPEEIRAFIESVREHFGNRKITAIFQPHLYSRTRDHASGFAEILDRLDEVFLLPIYPAREKPIEGVTSQIIFERMKLKNKKLTDANQVLEEIDTRRLDILLTIGAGDIDKLVLPLEKKLKKMLAL